jgi:hypothetical protein
MTGENFNMNEFYHSILLDIQLNDAFEYAASGGGLEKWFIGKAVFTSREGTVRKQGEKVKQGDTYLFNWLAKDFSVTGEVLEAADNSLFKFSFGLSFIVTISVTTRGTRTLFTLKQQYAPGAEKDDFAHINCCVCWTFFIANLKSVAEGGIDLREVHADDESLVNR